MYEFTPSELQEQLVNTARTFSLEHIIPVAHKYDEEESFPTEVFQKAFDLDLMNVEVPAEYGGMGLETVDGCLIGEQFAYGCPGIATSLMCNHLAALPLLVGGSEAQKEKWLGMLTEELCFASYACSEPEAGSDVAAMKTRLTRDGDGWIMNGRKRNDIGQT